jgi:acyl dehydratase
MSTQIEYYEDIELHQKSRSRGYLLEEKDIIDFAKKWDPQPFHVDPELAKNSKFGGLVAAGSHLHAICALLENERRPKRAWVSVLSSDKTKFVTAARCGDVLVLENEVISKRESKSDPNVGIVNFVVRLVNQRNEPVLTFEMATLVGKKSLSSQFSES